MSEDVLRIERDGGVATLTLNRPEARNALSRELRSAITRTFEQLQNDSEIGVVILTGAAPAFCAGLDLKELGGEAAAENNVQRGFAGNSMLEAIQAFDRPIIGAINGVAITGGFELALACDILIASSEARFADTHARVGILPGWGLSQKLPRLIGIHRAKQLSLTGNFLSAEQAADWGLVGSVVAPAELLPSAQALARDVLSCDPKSIRGYKRVIDEGFALPFREALALESRAASRHMESVTPEQVRGRRAAIQQRGRAQTSDS